MIKSLFSVLILSITLLTSGLANTVSFSGSTTGAPTFNRPTETGALSAIGTAVPFFVYQINVTTPGIFTFTVDAINSAVYDTFIHLYLGAFNPASTADPALNFVAGNDDRSLVSTNSSLTLALNASSRYFFVVDGFANSDFGAYSATISSANGSFTAAAVPESASTLALAVLALGGLIIARRCLQPVC